MKQVVKKMHGLNTMAYVQLLSPVNFNYGLGTQYQAALYIFNMSAPNQLAFNIPTWQTDPLDTQYWLKRLYTKNTYTNTGLQPIIMETWTIYCRTDLRDGETIVSIANEGVQGVTTTSIVHMPYTSFAIGDSFRKHFKVMKVKRRILKPLQVKTVTNKVCKKYLRKPISRRVEGDSDYTHREGNIITLVRFYGIPTNWTNAANIGTNETGMSYVQVRGIQHRYLSYYRMDDVTPTTGVASNADFSVAGYANLAWIPTYLNVAQLRDNDGQASNGSVPVGIPVVKANPSVQPPPS